MMSTGSLGLRLSLGLMCAAMLAASPSLAQQAAAPPAERPTIGVEADGALRLPAQTIPMSPLMSPELQASLRRYFRESRDPKFTVPRADGSTLIHQEDADVQDKMIPVNKDDTTVGGVHVVVYTPKEGLSAKTKNRVLIWLHSAGCWAGCAQLGAQPIAYYGKYKVVAVDYKDPAFPRAVGQVADVYKALLKTHKPQNIGIYGCSRGGLLVARSLAWFQKQKLPTPGAAGILCASAGPGAEGDSYYTGSELGNGSVPKGPPGNDPELGLDPSDPMGAPAHSLDILAKFPPTLMITATRGLEMSSAVYTHEALDRAGVESDLHVFEGGRHSFWYDPTTPESQQVYKIIIKYFDRHLGKSK